MTDVGHALGSKGGEGAPIISYTGFHEYCVDLGYDARWITNTWRVLIQGADRFGLVLIPDPEPDPRGWGKSIDYRSLCQAPIRAWESQKSNVWERTKLGSVSIQRLLAWRETLCGK